MKKIFTFMMGCGIALQVGCSIKPGDDGSDLGPETSTDEIDQSLQAAQSGLDQRKAFHVGDFGVIQIVDKVLSNTAIRETHDLKVTEINSSGIQYTERVRETNATGTYLIKWETPSTAQLDFSRKVKQLLAFLPESLSLLFEQKLTKAAMFFTHLSFEKTSAVGQTLAGRRPRIIDLGPLARQMEQNLQSLMGDGLGASATPPPPSPSSSPSEAAAEPKPPAYSSRYFGLNVLQHHYLTKNCAQFRDCRVSATHLDFNEVRHVIKSGADTRLHRSYEISTEVPGLFLILENCTSALIQQNGINYPLTECIHVDDFRFGS